MVPGPLWVRLTRPIHLERWAQYAGFASEGKGRVHDSVITMPESCE
jgi:hypothetical protein